MNLPIQNNTPLLNSLLEKANNLPDANERYEAGKKAEYDAFWDAFQENGNRTGYNDAFKGHGWADANFRPKYDIKAVGNALNLFANCIASNIKASLQACGVILDTSKATSLNYAFSGSSSAELPLIDCTGASTLTTVFSSAKLLSIDGVVLKEDGSQNVSAMFASCGALENVTFSGKIGTNISFDRCPKLSYDSLMSIINALKDYSGSGSTYTVTLGATNLAKLTDAEKQIATQKGWTLA